MATACERLLTPWHAPAVTRSMSSSCPGVQEISPSSLPAAISCAPYWAGPLATTISSSSCARRWSGSTAWRVLQPRSHPLHEYPDRYAKAQHEVERYLAHGFRSVG